MLDHINQRLEELRTLEVFLSAIYTIKSQRREIVDRYYNQISELWRLLNTSAEEVDSFSAKCQINLSNETIRLVHLFDFFEIARILSPPAAGASEGATDAADPRNS